MTTQNEELLWYLSRGYHITPVMAMKELGCMRLAARVCDLRKMGHKIYSRRVSHKNRFGRTISYNEYYM